jgi:type 1 glutamine amidotransferase
MTTATVLVAGLMAVVHLPAAPAAQAPATPQTAAPAGRGQRPAAPAGPRAKVLVVSGGCCPDYALQGKVTLDVMAKLVPVDWTVVVQGAGTRSKIPLYDNPDWAKGYDLVVHNECNADVDDEAFIGRITEAHKTGRVPGVVIHCAMHSYRAATGDLWREFLGVTSKRHTRAHNVAVKVADTTHPITAGMPATWSTPTDELYVIDKVWPGTTVLATAVSPEDQNEYPLLWAHEYNGARVAGTTLGHGNATWEDPVFQGILQRAMVWAMGRN